MTEQTLTPALHPTLNLPLPVKQPLPLTALSDEQLVHFLAEGRALSASAADRCASLLVIYDRHYPLCFAFALRLVNKPRVGRKRGPQRLPGAVAQLPELQSAAG